MSTPNVSRATRAWDPVAQRTVLSDDALSVAIPILEEIAGFGAEHVRALFDRAGFVIQEWDKVRTDWLTIGGLDERDALPVA